jgi:DNA-binding transcriptional ArsR family regulator
MGLMNAKQAVTALGAIGNDHRLAVYRMLVQKGPQGLPAGDIAARLDVPPSSLTFHLQHMLQAGLVTQRRLGRQTIYAADFAAMNGFVSYLTENCGGAGACAPVCEPAKTTRTAASRKRSA